VKELRLVGAVLAGGASRRFGRNKSVEPLDGRRLIDRAADALRRHTDEVIVVSSRSDTPAGGWVVVEDCRPSCGPLGGIEAALQYAADGEYDAAAVLAVDLPLVDDAALGVLIEAFALDPRRSTVAARDGDPDFEPLCAVYPTSRLEAVSGLLDAGERAARALFEQHGGLRVPGVRGAGMNVNREADLAGVAARVREERKGGS